jgi:hypothetical protein
MQEGRKEGNHYGKKRTQRNQLLAPPNKEIPTDMRDQKLLYILAL